jgi:16S rRNA U1498 N3-methylase RsmE
VEWVLLL